MNKFSINFLGLEVNVETDSSLLIRVLEKYRSLRSYEYSSIISFEDPVSIKMWSQDNKFIVEDSQGRHFFFRKENKAVNFCSNLFVGTCAERLQPRFSIFHGAAVCLDGEAFMFLGDSGAGKTTLSLSLLKEGFKLLSQDLSIVDLNTNFALPVKTKISLDKSSPFTKFFTPEMFDLSWNDSKIHVELEDIFGEDHWGRSSRLKSIFFLKAGNGRSPQIEPITQYQGFRRMCPFYIYGEKDLKIIVEQNSKIIENTTSYLVSRGNIDETVNLVKETLLEEAKC